MLYIKEQNANIKFRILILQENIVVNRKQTILHKSLKISKFTILIEREIISKYDRKCNQI